MHLKQAVPLPVDAGCFAALRSATRAPAASPLHWLFPPPVMLSSQTLTWLAPPADRSLLRCHLIAEAFSDPLSKTAPPKPVLLVCFIFIHCP